MFGDVQQVVLDKNGDLYVQAEIVDNTVADNEKDTPFTFVDDEAKRKIIQDLANKPYVLTKNLWHPDYTELNPNLPDDQWLRTYYQWQEKFAIGRVRSVFEAAKGVWRAWLHITNSVAKEAYLKGKIPKKVSVGFFSPEFKIEDGIRKVIKGVGLHVAAVLSPAWKNSVVKNECIGDDKCMSQIYQAGIPTCGFCIEEVLNSLKEDDCFHPDNNSNSHNKVFHGSVMIKLSELSDEEKERLRKELELLGKSAAKTGETEPPPAPKPEDSEKKPEEEGTTKKATGAPIDTANKKLQDTEDKTKDEIIKNLEGKVNQLLKDGEVQKQEKQKELTAVRESMIDSYVANEQDEDLRKAIKERAMTLPSNEDVRFWLGLKYPMTMEAMQTGKRNKLGHAGIETEYIDTRAVLKANPSTQKGYSPSVYLFGAEDD